ncbi:RNA/RNP complex-1-interacting phosphatase-like isoform X2 [Artemia franciscana]|uniref:RNA/RNP complex-1-interacting phosphatase-like isoform X2 n=1 Tax=Artemia franciscana TaxID=6661 RepID=UPI0032DB89CA
MGKGRVPDRWLDYTCFGNVINDTRLLALKVPLKKELCMSLKDEEMFTPDLAIQKIEHLGLIIDLAYTDRYYNPVNFARHGIGHEKIKCEGRSIPKDEVVRSFLHHNRDKVVGVHCTHGLNRTGYLICRYLIQRLGYTPGDALTAFNNARGHNIERKNYTDDLFRAKWSSMEPIINFTFTKRDYVPLDVDKPYNPRDKIGSTRQLSPAEETEQLSVAKKRKRRRRRGKNKQSVDTVGESSHRVQVDNTFHERDFLSLDVDKPYHPRDKTGSKRQLTPAEETEKLSVVKKPKRRRRRGKKNQSLDTVGESSHRVQANNTFHER